MSQDLTVAGEYLRKCEAIIHRIDEQKSEIEKAAQWFAETILDG